MENPTSLKQLIQSMIPDWAGVVEGTVTSGSPLEITLANDSKMILGANTLVIPEHLTDHEVVADIVMGTGILRAATGKGEGDGEHEHPGMEKGGKHGHDLESFRLMGGRISLHTGLKQGEKVFLLPYNNNKKYFVLDRKG